MQNTLTKTFSFKALPALALCLSLAAVSPVQADETPAEKPKAEKSKPEKSAPTKKEGTKKMTGTTAIFKTTLGSFTVKLFKEKAPKTVENFVGLATGTKEWTNPSTGQKEKGKSLYAGTIFHRVIEGFMIQGGDPLGKGIGGPGYKFEDEFSPTDQFDKPGILAMANAGPNTNGSQFFITVAPTPHLKQRHTIFGEVTSGMDIVMKISTTPTGPMDRPKTDVKIESITIE